MPNLPESTQCQGQGAPKSKVVYHWVILFMYDVEVEYPFSYYHVNELQDSEFPFQLVDGPLDAESRREPFPLFSGQKYCLFAKIEKGKQ